MTIKANHRHVDMEGCVYLPYLHEWTQKSNLVALTEMASNIFSFEPPLYTKPTTAPNPVPVPTTNQSTASAMASNAYTQSLAYVNNFSSINTRGQPVNNNPTPATTTTSSVYVPSTAFSSTGMYGNSSNTVMGTIVNNGVQPTSSYTTPSYTTNHHESDKRDILVLEVTSKLQSKLQEKHISIRKEIDEEFRNQRYIETNGEKLIKAKHEIELLKHNMNQSIWEISEKITKMTEFTKEQEANDSSSEKKKELEDFILPYDDISNQMIKVNAEMNGIDDVFYYLEKALINNKLDLNAFLKESRLLARKQFLAKSHLMKLENFLIHNSQVNVIPSDQPRTMIPAAPSSSSSVAAGGMGQHMPMYLPG
jgi:ESCRT-I complex subunit TSG101